ncbi:putative importin beta-5 subunit [Aspergillus clavatus NRRL 1]|uniref:Importin beta-5 subunit, putative n=1 Tax=Aspergillus clavatus (strain ATCC 1007 / CBS 513.65 / DSM 816 / NCTC 3887 / NRRL 1 / QM 1276 / 107) TaxID=344612 RepID=A1C7S4_ASPCL|nr:importin beta-5 subunit, putative [Aspergillus clavatus NRRL 1]EAW14445.1 importin beta-5 subunit, putative [Aspergillus clavatus NRRL 1]
MEQELLSLLADTQSPAADTRKAAELQLLRLYSNEQFPLSLAAIASHDSVPTNLRQSSLSVLRTFIAAAWSPNLDEFKGQILINDAHKAQIRRVLLDLATTADVQERKVKSSASFAVSKIASADFPDEWPELLPSLLQIINDVNSSAGALHGALKVLLDLVDTGFSEEQFFGVARDLVTTLFNIATNESRKPMLRALAVAVFRSCFDTLEMVLEQHKVAVKQFMDEVLSGWSPFFISTLKAPLPQAPIEQEESKEGEIPSQWRGAIGLKLQVVKTLMKIRMVFPGLMTAQSPVYFSTVWTELSNIQAAYHEFYIHDERQGRLEDVDGLPYTLDFLVLEELDLIQALLKAPPVKAELQQQLQNAGQAVATASWLPEILKLASSYAQITTEEEGLWDIDVNLFLSEETSVTANYTPRTCSGDLVVKLGEWLKTTTVEGLLAYMNVLFADSSSTWKSRESALFILNQLLRDFNEVSQQISSELANGFNNFVTFAIQQEQEFLRARGYLVAGILAQVAGDAFRPTATSYFEATLKAITEDPSEVVKVSCIRALQDLMSSLPQNITIPLQVPAINTLSEFISAQDLQEPSDSDDLKVTLAETVRDVIMVDPSVVLSSIAIDVLFNIASNGATNFQLTMIVTEAFEDIVENISEQGPDAFIRLCAKVLPSLTGAIDVGNLTQENALTNFAADLLRALTERALEPLPAGFVETVMPKLNRLLLDSTDAELIRPATEAVRHILSHDFNQFVAWRDPQSGKEAVEIALIIIDRLLSPSVDDNAATEVGQLAAELVEKAGSERLGPYLPQLLRAVAQRLATAEQAQFIQSLILVFARLTLINAHEVVDFLAQVDISGQSGLPIVLSKWLENSVNFAGYDEIKQNIIALATLYNLEDPRLAQVQVKGDLIIQDTGRIKTRSQTRNNPDRYTTVTAPLKIIKVLVEELAAASGSKEIDAAAAAALEEEDSDDDGEWEDIPSGTLDLNLGITKQELMAFGEGGNEGVFGVRKRDDETQAFLLDFFRNASTKPEFQQLFAALTPDEQEKLRSVG